MTVGTTRRLTSGGWQRRNRSMDAAGYLDAWYAEQCGRCTYWVPLAGDWGLDYGACTNPRSPYDGRVQFEYDGCDVFVDAEEWASPDDPGFTFTLLPTRHRWLRRR